jgi:hypothetical protein
METETALILAVWAGIPLAFLAGCIAHRRDMKAYRRELQESRYAYLARLEAHRLAWRNWTDEAMRESANNNKGEN